MAASEGVEGLERTFKKAALEGVHAKAAAWCNENGARFLEELRDPENFDDLVKSLELKPLEKKRLRKVLDGDPLEWEAPQQGLSAPPVAAMAPPAALMQPASPVGLSPPGRAGMGYLPRQTPVAPLCVKNTFLDLEDHQPEASGLYRAQTLPASRRPAADDDEAGDDGDAESGDDEPSQGAYTKELYKTTTCDMFEEAGNWAWTAGGPAVPTVDEERVAPAAATAASEQAVAAAAAAAAAGGLLPWWPADPMALPGYPSPMAPTHPMMYMVPSAASTAGFPVVSPMYYGMDRFSRLPPDAATSDQEPLKPLPLQRAYSVTNTGLLRVRWAVDGKILRSSDREKVSPDFELAPGQGLRFRMVMKALTVSQEKGGGSFQRAKGKGTIELRCLNEITGQVPDVTFRLAIGSGGDPSKQYGPRGPVTHNFAEHSICGLKPGQDEWDFRKAVDSKTGTFV
eukprot:CAMPEP_0178373984 /NCGR_PEP_ID=MMETSP0689_2-20121128/2144_1 /TAXON_ID=160604 /ORGANISM="Amphidinium massartii, Strain CS-259" /LENGTH=454 /DNA_ID=CAMNT_0019993943 /DNA_START=29 /DNA_END=1389 /DNA_ORIENTATION=+